LSIAYILEFNGIYHLYKNESKSGKTTSSAINELTEKAKIIKVTHAIRKQKQLIFLFLGRVNPYYFKIMIKTIRSKIKFKRVNG
jgi:hypothetical protein